MRRLSRSFQSACPLPGAGRDVQCQNIAGSCQGGPASMTYAELLRRSLEADAAGTLPPRDLVQAVLEQARRRAGGRSPPH